MCMSRFIIKLLLIAFLFGSVEASVDSVLIEIDHEHGSEHQMHDHDESNTNYEDECDHHCHCAGQLGQVYTTSIKSFQVCVIINNIDTHTYRSNLSPPLFRPPIA